MTCGPFKLIPSKSIRAPLVVVLPSFSFMTKHVASSISYWESMIREDTGSDVGINKIWSPTYKHLNQNRKTCSIHTTTHSMTIYTWNSMSPISLYTKLDKLQSLKKDFTCINVSPASTNQKPYFSDVYTGCRTL